MFRVFLLLEGEPPSQSQVFCRLQEVFFQYCPVFGSTHLPCPCTETPPQSMMLPPPYLAVGTVCSGWCALLVLHFGLIWPELLLPRLLFPTWLVSNCKQEFLWFYNFFFSCLSSIKAIFVQGTTNSCPMDRFPHLSCRSLQHIQSHHGPLGCISDQRSPCSACEFRWTVYSQAALLPFRLNSALLDVQSLGNLFVASTCFKFLRNFIPQTICL